MNSAEKLAINNGPGMAQSIAAEAEVETRGRIPGNSGIWVGIFCVLVEFLVLFTVYFIAKAHNPEAFLIGPDRLATVAGTTITFLLLTSGYCMVKAVSGGFKTTECRHFVAYVLPKPSQRQLFARLWPKTGVDVVIYPPILLEATKEFARYVRQESENLYHWAGLCRPATRRRVRQKSGCGWF